MKSIMNLLSYVPKHVMAVMAVVVIGGSAIAAPLMSANFATAAEGDVEIESTVKVANVTAGDETYGDSVDANVDEVVKIQLWYHNREDAFEGDVAENLRTAIDIPETQGQNQTITSTVSADNSNTVTDTAQVNLSLENAYLDYVEGSAKWRHNTESGNNPEVCETGNDPEGAPAECYTTEGIGDEVVTSESGVVLEDAKPCFAYEATVTVLARVKASEVKVNKYVSEYDGDRDMSNNDWKIENEAKPGDKLEYMIRFENKGNTVLENVSVGDNLPDYMEYIPGSTYIVNGNNEEGVDVESDNVYQGGIRVGDYNPGSAGYVIFGVKINDVNVFEECGVYTLKNVGVVRPEGMNEFYNTAHTHVEVPCEEGEQMARCDALLADKQTIQAGDTVNFTTEYTVENGATFEQVRYTFGDGSEAEVTDETTSHAYEEAGTYRAEAEVFFTVDGEQVTDKGNCVVKIDVQDEPVTEQPEGDRPEELPNTGPAEAIMAITGTGALGQGVRMYFASRKKLLGSLLNR